MKPMPMFLMLLLATAMSEGQSASGAVRGDKAKAAGGGLAAPTGAEREVLGEAERASHRQRSAA